MGRAGRYDNPYLCAEMRGAPRHGSCVAVEALESCDHAASHGFLWMPAGRRPTTAVMLMHPRADFARHYAVPDLLEAGYAVLTQNSRWLGNDSMLIHERVLLDVAAGVAYLRASGFRRVVACGNSGGGSLYTFYASQAHVGPDARIATTPAGLPSGLVEAELPPIDAIAYLAGHPGEGEFLLSAIDPSVTDECDPVSRDATLDMYDTANGFAEPPAPSRYDAAFVDAYRRAQRDRVARIDARARELVETRRGAARSARQTGEREARCRAVAVEFMTVYRTEADLRYTDPSIEPSARDYGSIFGRRPDLINYGPFGFARVVTPDAWLSTWSGLTSNASIYLRGPAVDVPAIVIHYDGDNCVFPSQAARIHDALASTQKSLVTVAGDHYGDPECPDPERAGRRAALRELVGWLDGLGGPR